jgi:hypothetical protein
MKIFNNTSIRFKINTEDKDNIIKLLNKFKSEYKFISEDTIEVEYSVYSLLYDTILKDNNYNFEFSIDNDKYYIDRDTLVRFKPRENNNYGLFSNSYYIITIYDAHSLKYDTDDTTEDGLELWMNQFHLFNDIDKVLNLMGRY